MNYEEMLNAREAAGGKGTELPIGVLRQTQIDHKYRFQITLKPTLADNTAFRDGLQRDHDWGAKHADPHRLHYDIATDSEASASGNTTLLLEPGNYQTLAQVLDANPAIVASAGFVDQMFSQLMAYASKLHANGIYQLCFAPQNIFLRKGSTTPLLFCHGSFFSKVKDTRNLYEGCESFVAPEVLEGGEGSEAADVYSLGKLIEFLFEKGGMTIEYKMLLKQATATDPAARFHSVEEMKSSLAQKRGMRRSVIAVIAALAIALICVWIYIDMMPQRSDMEFIEPVKKAEVDPFDDTYSPDVEMILDGDTITITNEDMEMYTQKAEEIFRSRFEEAAEEKLNGVFNKATMGSREKAILADSKQMQDQLEELKTELAEETGIDSERAAEIARDVVETKMAKKKKDLENTAVQKPKEENE